MTWGVLNLAMLAGLAGVAIPVVIHLLSRRRDPIVDWGAMQFLEIGTWQRRRLNLADILLLLARMGLLGLVALALARPFWTPTPAAGTGVAQASSVGRRDVVLIIDGSSSMARKAAGTTPFERAVAWTQGFVRELKPGDSVTVLLAKDRVRPVVDPPSFNFDAVEKALASLPPPRGAGDLATAIGEAFRVLERTNNPNREIVVLTDNQRVAWRPGETERWALLRELRRRLPVPPRLWAISFAADAAASESSTSANGSVGPLKLSRGALAPGRPFRVGSEVANAGPGALTRSVELLIDGKPEAGTARIVGPIPPGGRATIDIPTTLDSPGEHLLTIRLAPGDDPIPSDDEASRGVLVTSALPVLLVDGEPSLEPLGSEVAFLRAALAPTGDEARTIDARVVDARKFTPEALRDRKVLVLANVDRLDANTASAVQNFIASGGGVLIALGDRTDAHWWNETAGPWLPAKLGEIKGEPSAKAPVAHPAPASFQGPSLAPLGLGESPSLAEAAFFSYRALTTNPGSSVAASLDSGDPWIVERTVGRGKVILMSTAIDAEVGTLPVNPDFVPLVHELIATLGEGGETSRTLKAGDPLRFALPVVPPADLTTLPLHSPDGRTTTALIERNGASAEVRHSETAESGVYKLDLPTSLGGPLYAVVESDPRESDPTALDPIEARKLAEGWPLDFEKDPARLTARVLSGDGRKRNEVWKGLIYVALAGLCAEVWLTRRAAKARGLA